jgi:riboflavin kinase / FMN adenylyltransferase
MERLDGGSPVPERFRGGIVALGNFDGFHLGHQAVVGRAVARARAEGRPALVATFDPHPATLFRPDLPPFWLTTMEQRCRLFAEAGVDAAFVIRFDHQTAAISPRAFVEAYLGERIGAAAAVTGHDFTFGRARGGTVADLAAMGADIGMAAEAVQPVADATGTVSSTRIRTALRAGDPAEAARMLTRPFAIAGVVQPGAQLGRTIGYPTANLVMADYVRPAYGIYAVRGRLPDGRVLDGAANLGVRPSFDPPVELLEPYFFDFSGDLYGQEIEVELIAYLRPEAKFDTLDALKAQMAKDCEAARDLLQSSPGGGGGA